MSEENSIIGLDNNIAPQSENANDCLKKQNKFAIDYLKRPNPNFKTARINNNNTKMHRKNECWVNQLNLLNNSMKFKDKKVSINQLSKSLNLTDRSRIKWYSEQRSTALSASFKCEEQDSILINVDDEASQGTKSKVREYIENSSVIDSKYKHKLTTPIMDSISLNSIKTG